MNSSVSVRAILLFVFAVFLALWLGVSVATDQFQTLLKLVAAAVFIICILLGRKIWLLLIFFMALNVPLIRGFGTTELGQALFLGFTFIIFLLRRQPLNIRFGELEIWMLLLAACIVQVYLRNPVGLSLFGAGAVGARPYFMVGMAFLTGMVLGNIVVPPHEIKWSMRLSIIGNFLGIGLTTLRMRGAGGGIGLVGGTAVAANATLGDGQASSRIGALGSIGDAIARIVVAYVSPLRALLHPLWAPLILISVAAAAGSGYRNAVASVGLTYLIGLAYRGGFGSVVIAFFSGAMGLAALAFVNLAAPLPPNIQRALSPFPGTWEERHVEVAEQSTEWRVEMWKEALFTPHWIQNKLLGDGLGISAREYQMLQSMEVGGEGLDSMGSGMSQQQEAMMITGGYHSGPVQCVRIVGYVGLIVLLLAMIRMAVHAHRQILRCRGTEWYPIALFIGVPLIALPIFHVFIFGDFGRDVSATFFAYGIIRLLEKNLPLPACVITRKEVQFLGRPGSSDPRRPPDRASAPGAH
jgi:hypothetical protein